MVPAPSNYLRATLRDASFSLTLGVFLGAALTSGAVCGAAAFFIANERLLNRIRGQVKLLVLSARDAALQGRRVDSTPATRIRHVSRTG